MRGVTSIIFLPRACGDIIVSLGFCIKRPKNDSRWCIWKWVGWWLDKWIHSLRTNQSAASQFSGITPQASTDPLPNHINALPRLSSGPIWVRPHQSCIETMPGTQTAYAFWNVRPFGCWARAYGILWQGTSWFVASIYRRKWQGEASKITRNITGYSRSSSFSCLVTLPNYNEPPRVSPQGLWCSPVSRLCRGHIAVAPSYIHRQVGSILHVLTSPTLLLTIIYFVHLSPSAPTFSSISSVIIDHIFRLYRHSSTMIYISSLNFVGTKYRFNSFLLAVLITLICVVDIRIVLYCVQGILRSRASQ